MVLIVQRGSNRQNNEGRPLFDKRYTNKEKMWPNALKEFPNYGTTSLEYFVLSITVTFVFADWP